MHDRTNPTEPASVACPPAVPSGRVLAGSGGGNPASQQVDARAVRAACESLFATLHAAVGRPLTGLADFVAVLSDHRGKRIRPMRVDLPPSMPCGLTWGAEDADYISIPLGVSSFHANQILMHEIAHLVLKHPGQIFARGIGADNIYADPCEFEAEIWATHAHTLIAQAPGGTRLRSPMHEAFGPGGGRRG